ncbi:MAG: PIN domain-containing protein [Pyrobaculum sp.]
MSTEAVVDTSFLIDWARYSKRELIYELFDLVWIPEPVLSEIKSASALEWVAQSIASGKMAYLPEFPEYREAALRLIAMSRRFPVRGLDYPEAYCIALAESRGHVVLSENGGAYAAQYLFTRAKVWRAFEVLYELVKRGKLSREDVLKYQEEAHHRFSRRDLQKLGL